MATNNGAVLLDTRVVARITEFSFDSEAEWRDTTAQGDQTRQKEQTFTNTSGQCSAWFKDGDAGQALIVPGAELDIIYAPYGYESGKLQYSGPIRILKMGQTFPLEDGQQINFDWEERTNGMLAKGLVP